MKHRHHIIPKHMNGSDEPDNLIELSIEEHAEAHRILYEQHGKIEDYCAWQGLLGYLPKAEIIKKILSETAKKTNSKRKGIKRKPGSGNRNPKGTGGSKWYHNPDNPFERGCFYPNQNPPEGWVLGQGKKKVNPGSNFHKNK